jgi:phosphoglycerol transferase MdoB-like AlkP superfamily enzyme
MSFIIISIVFRAFSFFSAYEPIAFINILRGFLSDIVQCIPFLLLYNTVKNKYGKFIVFILFSILISANTEHILVNRGNISYEFVGFIKEKQFLNGSALSTRPITFFLISLLALSIIQLSTHKIKAFVCKFPKKLHIRKPLLLLTPVTLTSAIHVSVFYPSWHQQSVLEQNFRYFFENHILKNHEVYINQYITKSEFSNIEDIKKHQNGTYSALHPLEIKQGSSILNNKNPEKNVLLIFIEGLSQFHVYNNYLPNIRKLGQENFSLTHFITPQRQTNRGLYATFCSKYPNFISRIAKSDIVGTFGPDTICLPEILKINGYETVFFQSADLGFMSKDRFTKKIGFTQSYGNPDWRGFNLKTDWGVDDITLYDYAIEKISELNKQNKKWFLSLLTVSTHHPYLYPGSTENPSYEGALSFADGALASFIKTLKQKKFLDDTLVIILSDEANAEGKTFSTNFSKFFGTENHNSNFLHDNHGPIVVLGRRTPSEFTQDQVFSQTDIAASIVDYLNINNPQPIGGRSIFRTYPTTRKVYFGNVYRDHFGYVDGTNKLVLCNLSLDCYKINKNNDIFTNNQLNFDHAFPVNDKEKEFIQRSIDINDIYTSNFIGNLLFSEENKIYQGKLEYKIIGHFKVMGNEEKPVNIQFKIDNSISKESEDIALKIAAFNPATRDYNKIIISISSGEVLSAEKKLLLPRNEYYYLNISASTTNEEKWKLDRVNVYSN